MYLLFCQEHSSPPHPQLDLLTQHCHGLWNIFFLPFSTFHRWSHCKRLYMVTPATLSTLSLSAAIFCCFGEHREFKWHPEGFSQNCHFQKAKKLFHTIKNGGKIRWCLRFSRSLCWREQCIVSEAQVGVCWGRHRCIPETEDRKRNQFCPAGALQKANATSEVGVYLW